MTESEFVERWGSLMQRRTNTPALSVFRLQSFGCTPRIFEMMVADITSVDSIINGSELRELIKLLRRKR